MYKTAAPDRYGLLRQWARENRRNATVAEDLLWGCLRGERLGTKFLRQHIIGDYIADFCATDLNLIIEVDGGYHSEPRQVEHDELRTEILNEYGYEVIRFSNEQIMNDLSSVVSEIEEKIETLQR